MTIKPANWSQYPLMPAGFAVWYVTREWLQTVFSHFSFVADAWKPKQLTGLFLLARDDHKPTRFLPQVAEGSLPINKSNYITTLQSCLCVWLSVCGCFVCACVYVCNCSSQRVNVKTQQNDKWGQGTKLYFFLSVIIGMKSSEAEHSGHTVHLIFKGKQRPHCGQLGAQIALHCYYWIYLQHLYVFVCFFAWYQTESSILHKFFPTFHLLCVSLTRGSVQIQRSKNRQSVSIKVGTWHFHKWVLCNLDKWWK